MLTDREFLIWLHERLEHRHGEDHCVDYMHRLRDIIMSTPVEQRSKSTTLYWEQIKLLSNRITLRLKEETMYVLLLITMLNSVPISVYPTQEQCLADGIYWKHIFPRDKYSCVSVADSED